jgi:predicted small secreted protein
MKTNILKLAFVGLLAFAVLGCNNATENKEEIAEEKMKEEEINTMEIDQDRKQSSLDSAEYALYREESETRLMVNERKIAHMKEEARSEKKDLRLKYEKALDELHQKNTTMKTRIREYKKDIKNDWDSFKLGFNKDIDELGKAISAMAEKNMKKK